MYSNPLSIFELGYLLISTHCLLLEESTISNFRYKVVYKSFVFIMYGLKNYFITYFQTKECFTLLLLELYKNGFIYS